MLRLHQNRKAFSLIEVMMGATILVIGFIGLIQAVTMGSEMVDTARKQMIAQQIIDAEIAKLRLCSWGTGPATPPPLTISAPTSANPYSITISQDGSTATGDTVYFELSSNNLLMGKAGGFTVGLTVTDIRANFRQFVYTVTWRSNTGRPYSRTGTAYFGNNGLHLSYQKA